MRARMSGAAAATVALAVFGFSPSIVAQRMPGRETSRSGPGLATRSPRSVLADPRVQRCRALAARRAGDDPDLTSIDTVVERAAALLELAPVLDAVATCRAALRAFPNEPAVIIPHFTASESLSLLVLGIRFPESDEEKLALALKAGETVDKPSGIFAQMLGFFLGSAYEYGIGAEPDRAAAIRWYAVAAGAGDLVSQRELARLRGDAR